MRIALTELRRKRWRDASLDELTENEDVPPPPGLLADPQAGPETSAERADMMVRVRRIIDEELTERQRQALLARRAGHAHGRRGAQTQDQPQALYNYCMTRRDSRTASMEGITP